MATKAKAVTPEYSDTDIARVKAFVESLSKPAEYQEGKTIKRLAARIYKQLWFA